MVTLEVTIIVEEVVLEEVKEILRLTVTEINLQTILLIMIPSKENHREEIIIMCKIN